MNATTAVKNAVLIVAAIMASFAISVASAQDAKDIVERVEVEQRDGRVVQVTTVAPEIDPGIFVPLDKEIVGLRIDGAWTTFVAHEKTGFVFTAIDSQHSVIYRRTVLPGESLSELAELTGVHFNNPLTQTEQRRKKAVGMAVQAVALPSGWGAPLGSFSGVTAYSNGPDSKFVSNIYGSYGMRYQCTEYFRRFYGVVYSRNIGTGNAADFWTNRTAKYLVGFGNGGSTAPRVGDILISMANVEGHGAIVTSVQFPTSTSLGYVKVIQQNWPNRPTMTLIMSAKSSYGIYTSFSVSGFNSTYPVKGWLRRK